MGVENFLRRVDERLLSIISGAVFVVPQLHPKIQQLFIWLTWEEVLVIDQMLEFGGISGIIDIDCAWSIGRLPALPPLHDSLVLVFPLPKLWLHGCLQLGSRDETKTCLEPWILIELVCILEVRIHSHWCKFKLQVMLLFIIMTILYCFGVFPLPLLKIVVVESWRVCLHVEWWALIGFVKNGRSSIGGPHIFRENAVRDSETKAKHLVC